MDKREVVQRYLHELCGDLEILESMHDPDPVPQKDIDDIIEASLGLIHYVKYEPGSDEWESFYPEGWLCNEPSTQQVEEMYERADMYFQKLMSDGIDAIASFGVSTEEAAESFREFGLSMADELNELEDDDAV